MVKNRINHSRHLMQTSKKDLFSDQSFCSTAVTSCFLFMLLLKEMSRQTGHLPISCFNSILNLTPMLIYDTEKKQKSDFAEENRSKTRTNRDRGCFLYKCPQFLFFKGGRSYVALFPFNHSSRSQQRPHSSCSSDMATFLVLSSYPTNSLRHGGAFEQHPTNQSSWFSVSL